MRRSVAALLLSGLVGLSVAPGCDKTRGVAPLKDGKAECLELGELCHGPGQDLGGQYQECHNVGHRDDGPECLRLYEECRDLCEEAPQGHGGAGGEGGGAGAAAH